MKIVQEAINGKERDQMAVSREHSALIEFYKAFNSADIVLMHNNWLHAEYIAMDNPLGGIKRGWDEIRSVYERIFNGNADVYVEFYDYNIITMDGGFCAVGRERGSVSLGSQTVELKIRTSRVFQDIEGAYKQVHHHGSIESPELLKAYQTLLS